jgi:hypothetical protein
MLLPERKQTIRLRCKDEQNITSYPFGNESLFSVRITCNLYTVLTPVCTVTMAIKAMCKCCCRIFGYKSNSFQIFP